MSRRYFVYILASESGLLYTGVTSNLLRHVFEHKSHAVPGFTSRYNVHRLVWAEETNDVSAAIEYEKMIKGWTREKKVQLIEQLNPEWKDLSQMW